MSAWNFAAKVSFSVSLIAAIATAQDARAQGGTDLTYYKDILPIFQRHCLSCHHVGGPSPQSLETYKKARPWLRTSKKMMEDHEMVPWQADRAIGKWKNYDVVSDKDIEIMVEWIGDRAPEGEPSEAPAPMDFSAEWKLGEPDKIFEMSEPFALEEEGEDVYRAFVVSPAMESDTWLRAVEFRPGEMDAVADIWLSAAPIAEAQAADEADAGPGFEAFDRGWTEGSRDHLAIWNKGMTLFESFPEGTGALVPKGFCLVLMMHYVTVGDPIEDRTKVAIQIAQSAPDKEMKTLAIENRELSIPEESYDFEVRAERTLDKAITVHTILPRMFYFGTRLLLTAHMPDGEEKLLKIDVHSYKLHAIYTPLEPIELPKGTRLEVIANYENSYDNENNPNTVLADCAYGPGPKNEILSVVLQYTEN